MAIALVCHKNTGSSCFSDLRVALFELSHTGQESHWLGVSDGRKLSSTYKSSIPDIMSEANIPGYCGTGRVSSKPGARPAYSYANNFGDFVVAFDGYIINGDALRARVGGSSDGDVAARFIADAGSFERGVENLAGEAKGHFCLTMMTEKGYCYAARCPKGVRTAVYGEGERGGAIVSESRALSHIDMKRVRDIGAGEIVGIDGSGLHTLKQLEGERKVCSFLWAYYNWIDSFTEGGEVGEVRSRIGAALAKADMDAGLVTDIVAPVPDSGKGYAEGYAERRGCLHSEPLIKYPYAGRSYDRPNQNLRDLIAGVKLNVVPSRARGKRIALTDDSIRRGTQLVKKGGPIDLLRGAGAKEIHLRIGSPVNVKYCRCSPPEGDAYEDGELAALRFTREADLAKFLGVDSVRFIGLDDFVGCITGASGVQRDNLCLGCYTGDFGFLE